MQIRRGTHAGRRKLAAIAAAGLCLGSVPAFFVAGSASAQGSSATVDWWGRAVHNKPVSVTLPAPVTEVGTNNSAWYALLNNGQVWAWGYTLHGELGNGTSGDTLVTTPVQVQFPAGVTIASIPTNSDPWDTAYAIDTNGNVWGWGGNAGGELCMGNLQSYTTPVEITAFTNVTAVAGADQHTTYDENGILKSCGANTDGDLGDGKTANAQRPVAVSGLSGQGVTAVVSGYNNVGVLYSNGEYYDWGLNSLGQLGDGNTTNSSVPVPVTLPATATQVAQGGNGPKDGQTLVMLSNGAVYAWGANSSGQLGTGNLTSKSSPVQIQPPAGVIYQTLAAGGSASYAVSTTGTVYAWGANNAGQLGDGGGTGSKTPVELQIQATTDPALISATSNNVDVNVEG
jgi:alpha-tubulin suppressor-like RCC1 family protein